MRLTPAGTLLLEFLAKQAEQIDDFRDRFDEHLKTPRGLVRIVAIEGVLARLLPEFVKAFQALHPNIKLSVVVVGSNTAAEMVAEQKADLGLLFGPSPRGDLMELAFMRQPLCLVLSPKHPLASKRMCSIAEVKGYKVALPDKTFGIRQEIDRVAALSRVELDLAIETNSVSLMRQLAVDGCALTFLPRHAVTNEVQAGLLTTIPLLEKRLSKTRITLVRAAIQPLSPSAQRASTMLRSMMATEQSQS